VRRVEVVELEVYIPDEGAEKGDQDAGRNRVEVDPVAALWEMCQSAATLGFRMVVQTDAEAEEAVAG
jgi:elongation factor P hydroxylase